MANKSSTTGLPVPSKRLSRLWHIGRATTDLAAGIGVRGMLQMARTRPGEASRIQLNPAATKRLTDRLARMRGAVMKMGQLMSMDGSDVFTPEAAEIMATLRDRAEPMPMSQLTAALEAEWGRDWNKQFRRFDFQPMAAASIGQVHRAETRDGRRLALKVQFPGHSREHRQRCCEPWLSRALHGHGAEGHGHSADAGRGPPAIAPGSGLRGRGDVVGVLSGADRR